LFKRDVEIDKAMQADMEKSIEDINNYHRENEILRREVSKKVDLFFNGD
jgi:hypothetical protein